MELNFCNRSLSTLAFSLTLHPVAGIVSPVWIPVAQWGKMIERMKRLNIKFLVQWFCNKFFESKCNNHWEYLEESIIRLEQIRQDKRRVKAIEAASKQIRSCDICFIWGVSERPIHVIIIIKKYENEIQRTSLTGYAQCALHCRMHLKSTNKEYMRETPERLKQK